MSTSDFRMHLAIAITTLALTRHACLRGQIRTIRAPEIIRTVTRRQGREIVLNDH